MRNNYTFLKRVFKAATLIVFGFFTYLMVRLTIPYFSFEDGIGFMRIKPLVLDNQLWKSAFYVHVITSCLVLPAGFTQFSNYILVNQKKVHRFIGKLYVIVILFLSGPSGFIMGIYANGGIPSKIAFIALSIFWIYTTFQAYSSIKKNEIQKHRQFVIRSFALTLSAITLRAWKYVIVLIFRPQPMDAYMIVAWLGWVPNLIVAEMIIQKTFNHLVKYKKTI